MSRRLNGHIASHLQRRARETAEPVAGNAPITLEVTKEAVRRIRRTLSRDEGEDLILRAYERGFARAWTPSSTSAHAELEVQISISGSSSTLLGGDGPTVKNAQGLSALLAPPFVPQSKDDLRRVSRSRAPERAAEYPSGPDRRALRVGCKVAGVIRHAILALTHIR
jgi:hypothetical protein